MRRSGKGAGASQQWARPTVILGIGASAGGLEACTTLLSGLSSEAGLGVVLVVHLDPNHNSVMAELLNRASRMPVVQATDGCPVQANHVYVVPPKCRLGLEEGVIRLSPLAAEDRRNPIDLFLTSLANDQKRRAVGIILSGNGTDGTLGLRAIKESGGLTLVQDPESAACDGMPRSALADLQVDRCLSLEEMPGFLALYAERLEAQENGPPEAEQERFRLEVCQLLKRNLRHDFSGYKRSTMLRRIHRRMLVVGVGSLEAYAQLLDHDHEEAQNLLRELLISVTRFFRDPKAFDALLPTLRSLIERKGEEMLRIWVPACATGEEAYSLAMLVVEEFERAGKPILAQIFATDIDDEALKKARQGRYPEAIAGHLTPARLNRFFSHRGDHYEVAKTLRAMCLFSLHNVASDPPFSRIDLISSRNLLIYLDHELQARVLAVFHYSLNTGGVLFLGAAEAISDQGKLFRTVDKFHRIFEAQPCAKRPSILPYLPGAYLPPPAIEPHAGLAGRGLDSASHLSRFLLPWLDITVLVLDDQDRIKDSCGHPDWYLRIRPGPMDDSLFALLKKEWVSTLRVALHQSRRERKAVVVTERAVTAEGKTRRLEIRVCPYQLVGGGSTEGWLVVFQQLEEVGRPSGSLPADQEVFGSILVEQMEMELESARQRLRATNEELESYNEELRSTNEELLSMNEELQSSNEELESSREEIQSVNQELQAVNRELLTSIAERDRAHSDLLQLFSSNPNPTIFLDEKLRIRHFTPAAVEVFHLLPGDRGRPLQDIRSRFSGLDLLTRCEQVCRTTQPQETVLTRHEPDSPPRSYQIRILPNLGSAGRLEGVLLNFIDITELQQAKDQAERRERQLSAVAELGQISVEKSLDRLFSQAVQTITRVLSVDAVCLLGYSSEQETYEFLCAEGAQPREHSRIIELPAVTQTVSTGRSVTFSRRVEPKPAGKSPRPGPAEICSGITTAIPESKEAPWVLCAFGRKAREFTFDEVDFLESIASLLGTAMACSQEHFLNALDHVVAGALAHPLGFLGVKKELLKSLTKEFDASACELWLPDPVTGALSLFASGLGGPVVSIRDSQEVTARGVSASGLIAKAWEGRAPVWVSRQLVRDPRAGDSGFAIPMLSGNERFGVLSCFFPRCHFYSQRLMASLSIAGLSLGECIRRTQAERALKESENRLFQALKAVPFPLAIIEEGLGFQLVSDTTYQLTGFCSADLSNLDDWTKKVFRGPAAGEAVLSALESSLSSSEVRHHGIAEIWTAAGTRARWDITTAPLAPSAEGRRRMVAVAFDVSEREASRRQLEEAARHKDGFLAMLGHELRNPLAAIRNGVQLIAMADNSAEHDEAMGIIDRQSCQMALLIDGLLDLNRISLGKVSLDPVPLSLTQLVETVVEDKRGQFKAKGLDLLYDPGPTPVWVRGDRVRMVQVLDNLLGNSLKFMEAPGVVNVGLSVHSERVSIKISDTGQGMTPELAAVVFEPFRQGEQTLARSHGGLGLGLSLVKQIVELHGGTVEVFSQGPGLGCEFSISLARCEPAEEPHAGEAVVETLPWSILYVEDDLDLALSLGRLLEASGHEVRHAFDARVALDLVAARPPQIILCDLGLPGGMDGYGLLEQFQKIDSLREVPVVAVTGYGLTMDKARIQSAGFAAHLTKPFEVHDVQRLLQGFPRPPVGQIPRADFCRVLVVDDNLMIARGTARMLTKAGFEARYAVSGAEALRIADEHSPHLALLDLGLPDCDGLELKEKLTLLSPCQGCVYLAVTGSDEAADMERTRRAGFVAHLVKPVSLERLLTEFGRIALRRDSSSLIATVPE